MNALILAGSRGGADPVADYAGVSDKALIRFGEATMLERVVIALREAGIDRIAVSANAPAVRAEALRLGAEPLDAAGGPSLSTLHGLQALGAPLLVTTADHALLRPEWVRDFLTDAPADADVAALLAHRSLVERDAPPTRRTWLRFADGGWSGCNLFLCRTPQARAAVELWMSVEANRKRPWRIVRRLGIATLARYALGRLTLAEAVARLGAVAGVRAAVVSARHGLAAVDVDKPADLDLVRSLLADAQ
ncbi:nucleotidyltransferase family protein [Sphingomonas sp. RP10(2022)]|uniref:Nucleotidyltransferase family protein n=1 Tax=Sphingomonas liriopis TaxID=2949094 RepID=A0A9X2HS00_9SPHN|nr:nucleotidyltransferase family protein [Sphingomonas liriopis]MCP3734369.1 nucleotidyltransferase family protein [Sphingomonas liriopis]